MKTMKPYKLGKRIGVRALLFPFLKWKDAEIIRSHYDKPKVVFMDNTYSESKCVVRLFAIQPTKDHEGVEVVDYKTGQRRNYWSREDYTNLFIENSLVGGLAS